MEKNYNVSTPLDLAKTAVKILDDHRASGLKLLHVEKKTIIADYFVICSGNSNTQIRALANELDFELEKLGVKAIHTDGLPEATWVAIDYGSVIIHIFNSETRNFYNLEKLYSEAELVEVEGLVDEQ